ncbi:MAG TPA: hydroxymethylbilane synthase [Candidatus Saccharimonadales bacterium]|nr:hydroxymethylbilane synthase [Candidatus Saccharimonadales bacterium]
MNKIIIGARGSQLSLAQTKIVEDLLIKQNPALQIEIKVVKTTGDKNMNPVPLDTIGKGWFTKELDSELLLGKIDMAVHSLKDIPENLPRGLIISAIPKREDAREVLISKNGIKLKDLKKGARIGTDSIRRRVQIMQKRTDLTVESIRGNVPRRIEKLENGEYDALILASAGLIRLGLTSKIAEYYSPTDLVPSPGQGALAIVTKKSNNKLNRLLKKINHKQTILAVSAERAFSDSVGGGCKMPVGAYAICAGEKLTLYGMLGSMNGENMIYDKIVGKITKPKTLGRTLAKRIIKRAQWYEIIKN